MSEHPTADELLADLANPPNGVYEVARTAIAALRAAEEDAEVGRLLRELDANVAPLLSPKMNGDAWRAVAGGKYAAGPTPLAALRALKDSLS